MNHRIRQACLTSVCHLMRTGFISSLRKVLRRFLFPLAVISLISPSVMAGSTCRGHFINPLTDICWSCLFPLSLGDVPVVSSAYPDTPNPSMPLQVCPAKPLFRVGLAIGYWEPFAITDVTKTPYCLVNLGGIQPEIPIGAVKGTTESPISGGHGAFYQVHWYKYPLMAWLNLVSSVTCLEGGDYDIGYVSELDPTWGDDELSFLVNPESIIFANSIAQAGCVADAVAASVSKPLDTLFWCLGAQGPAYPLTGHISEEYSVLQNATLLSERLAYRLHRLRLIEDSSGKDKKVCSQHFRPILPKSRYRYELMNPVADALLCHPFGRSSIVWQTGKLRPDDKGNYGYLIWRKRNCVFL